MESIAEKFLRSEKLMNAVNNLLQVGIEDNVGATMFSSADVFLSSDGEKIEITLYPNDYYLKNYERNYGHGIPERKKLD